MNCFCTSRIILSREIRTGVCTATYYETHYGHGNDMAHLRLSDELRKTVASQLLAGKTSQDILESLQDHKEVIQQRDLLLKKKDIDNIKKSFNIPEGESKTLEAGIKIEPERKSVPGRYADEIKRRHETALVTAYRVDYREKLFFVYYAEHQCPYIVKEKPGVSCCELKCIYCNICVHKYECTCKDFTKKALICEHIHFVYLNKIDIINGIYETHQNGFDVEIVTENTDLQQNDSEVIPSDAEIRENDVNKFSNDTDMEESDSNSDDNVVGCKRHKMRAACLKLLRNIESKSYTRAEQNFIYNQLKVLNGIKMNEDYNKEPASRKRQRSDSASTVENIQIVYLDN